MPDACNANNRYGKPVTGRMDAARISQNGPNAPVFQPLVAENPELLAGVEGLEPPALGFGDRCSTN